MMKRHLLLWILRPALSGSLLLAVLSLMWVLFESDPLWETPVLPAILIFLHTFLTTAMIYWAWGRAGSFAYVQTRGHLPETLWRHRLGAGYLTAAIVWLPAAIVVLSPCRSWLQGEVFQNPYYPIMHARDVVEVGRWFLLYLVTVPAAHYAWIRQAQPCRFPGTGHWLLAGLPVLLYTWYRCLHAPLLEQTLYAGSAILLTLILSILFLLGGRRLSQSMELSQS